MTTDSTRSPASAGLLHNEEPIAALATAGGLGAIAIIRVSGTGSLALLRRFFQKDLLGAEKKLRYGAFVDPKTGEVLDELMVAVFKGPRSYTGQDGAELFCHGGPYIVSRILSSLYEAGFRPAEPGEFTQRAFLNGKMDLTAAEGVRELIHAQTQDQWRAARQLATGRLADRINHLRTDLIKAMAYLEALIDFPDEGDTRSVELKTVEGLVRSAETRMKELASTYDGGRVASQGLKAAILGEPNVGKSTLMNTLLQKERAIVTGIAGTTRDYLEEACLVKGRLIRLIDTAGIRETTDVVERLGVERSHQMVREADIVLALYASSSSLEERTRVESWLKGIPEERILRVVTKIDQGLPEWGKDWLKISCLKGTGMAALEDAIANQVDQFIGSTVKEEAFITSARHLHALQLALEALARFFQAKASGEYEECLAFELQDAAKSLAAIIGAVENDDILDKVFSDFCVGK